MTDPTITKDPFLRKTALTAAGIALLLLAAGAVAFWLLRPGPVQNFEIDVRLVEPTAANRVVAEGLACPSERGASPLPGTTFRDQARMPEGSAFGAGQAVAYVVKIDAGVEVPDVGRWNLTWSDGFEQSLGVACAFVVTDDPETAEGQGEPAAASWFPGRGEDSPTGQLVVSGIEANEQVVVQLIGQLRAIGDESERLSFDMTPVTGTTSNSLERTDRPDFALPTGLDEELLVVIDDADGADPGRNYDTVYTVSNPTEFIISNIGLEVRIEGDVSPSNDVTVSDEVGFPTRCSQSDDDVLSCNLGFLNPGESVSIETTTRTRRSATAFWSRSDGPCDPAGQQDVCITALATWTSAFSASELELTEATNLADGADLAVRMEAPTEVVYFNRTVQMTIIVASDIETGVRIDEVNVVGCIEPNIPILIDGDTDLDDQADPGELWQYTCAARYDENGVSSVEVLGTANGQPVRGTAEIGFEVINPFFEIERIVLEGQDDVILRVTNTGDDPISRIALTANQCNPRLTSNADGDEVLEPEEVWEYACPPGATGGDVFGRDSLGAPLSAAVVDP